MNIFEIRQRFPKLYHRIQYPIDAILRTHFAARFRTLRPGQALRLHSPSPTIRALQSGQVLYLCWSLGAATLLRPFTSSLPS